MRRRTYNVSPKRERVVREAISTMRAARRQICPQLLDEAKKSIGTAFEKLAQSKETPIAAKNDGIDRRKNLNIIMRYLEISSDNQELKKLLKDFQF
jgi:hypothetical protein